MKSPVTAAAFAAMLCSLSNAHEEVPRHSEPSHITAEGFLGHQKKLRESSLEEKVQYLIDRAQIEDCITVYAYSVDSRNWPLHVSIFSDQFKERGKDTFYTSNKKNKEKGLAEYFKKFTSTQHLGFPLLIHIDGDNAYAIASLHARHYDKSGKPENNTLLFGHYELWFNRTEDGWKVNKLAQINRTLVHTCQSNEHED